MSNRDVAPRLRALDERVKELEGGSMSDLEQKAREVWDRITKQRQMIQGGYEVPYEEPLPSGLILQALRDVREADAKVVRAIASNRLQEGWGASYALSFEEAADAILAQGVK